jgi:hypothetical protein
LKDALNRIKPRNAGLEMGKRSAGEATLRAVIRAAPQIRGWVIRRLCRPHSCLFLQPSAAAKSLRSNKR